MKTLRLRRSVTLLSAAAHSLASLRELANIIVSSGWGLLELRPMRMSLEERLGRHPSKAAFDGHLGKTAIASAAAWRSSLPLIYPAPATVNEVKPSNGNRSATSSPAT